MATPFRDRIIHELVCGFYELEIHSNRDILDSDGNKTGRLYPERPDANPDASDLIRNPNPGYCTPIWQTFVRPCTPQDVRRQNLIPSVFLHVIRGTRSATGRGLQNSPVRATVNDIVEDYTVRLECPFRCDVGAVSDAQATPRKAKTITEQVNGFVEDIDKLINFFKARPTQDANFTIADVYLTDWEVAPALEGSEDELFMADILFTIIFNRDI